MRIKAHFCQASRCKSDTYSSYGNCSNLWGSTQTPADINAANFGLVFASIDYSCGSTITSFIDHVHVTVCYNSTCRLPSLRLQPSRRVMPYR